MSSRRTRVRFTYLLGHNIFFQFAVLDDRARATCGRSEYAKKGVHSSKSRRSSPKASRFWLQYFLIPPYITYMQIIIIIIHQHAFVRTMFDFLSQVSPHPFSCYMAFLYNFKTIHVCSQDGIKMSTGCTLLSAPPCFYSVYKNGGYGWPHLLGDSRDTITSRVVLRHEVNVIIVYTQLTIGQWSVFDLPFIFGILSSPTPSLRQQIECFVLLAYLLREPILDVEAGSGS